MSSKRQMRKEGPCSNSNERKLLPHDLSAASARQCKRSLYLVQTALATENLPAKPGGRASRLIRHSTEPAAATPLAAIQEAAQEDDADAPESKGHAAISSAAAIGANRSKCGGLRGGYVRSFGAATLFALEAVFMQGECLGARRVGPGGKPVICSKWLSTRGLRLPLGGIWRRFLGGPLPTATCRNSVVRLPEPPRKSPACYG